MSEDNEDKIHLTYADALDMVLKKVEKATEYASIDYADDEYDKQRIKRNFEFGNDPSDWYYYTYRGGQ